MTKVCVLMSTYNGERYLNEQLASIFSQSFDGNIELLVRDDGSVDNTLKILNGWAQNKDITIIRGSNVGPKESFFELVKSAPSADFYSFADQDDVWEKTKIASGVEGLLALPPNNPNLYFANAYLVDGNLVSYDRLFHQVIPNFTLPGSMVCNPALGCTIMFNRPLLSVVRDVRPLHTSMHDKFFMLTALLLGNVRYDHVPQMKYRQHHSNVCGREGSLGKRIKQTTKLWFSSKNITLEKQADELLAIYNNKISDMHRCELKLFSEYKKSLYNKANLFLCKNTVTTNSKANRSFIIRTLLGLA